MTLCFSRLQMRFICAFFVFAYGFLIDFVFGLICYKFSGVQGYQCGLVEWVWVLLSVLLAATPSLFLPLTGKRPSIVILWIVYFSHIIPSIITFPYLVDIQSYQDAFWPFLIAVLYILVSLISGVSLIKPPAFILPGWVFAGFILSATLFALVVLIKTYGFNLSPPALDAVYAVRAIYKEQGTVLSGYLAVISGFAISPFLLVAAARLRKSNWVLSIVMVSLAIILSYTIYASSGFKSVAFSGFVSLVLYFLFSRVRDIGFFMSLGIPIFVAISLLLFFIIDFEILIMHWVRRVFLVPGMNVSYFYDYMKLVGGAWEDAPKIISLEYYGTAGSANAGLFGDALARYGFWGLAINIPVFILVLKFSDFVTRHNDLNVYCALFALSAYAISNSSITTVFVTYGYLFISFSALLSGRFLNFKKSTNSFG